MHTAAQPEICGINIKYTIGLDIKYARQNVVGEVLIANNKRGPEGEAPKSCKK